jgi:peptidoglycan/LPS O-acetylase OafA/YrhL
MTAASAGAAPRPQARRLGAVAAGLVTIVGLSVGTDAALRAAGVFPSGGEPMPDALFALATAYRCAYAVLGSYVAARLAPDRPMRHALALGWIGVALCVVGAVASSDHGPELGPRWYPVALVATAFPCAWAGGRIRTREASAADGLS